MNHDREGHVKATIVDVARAMLEGSLGIIKGSRRLDDLRESLGICHMEEAERFYREGAFEDCRRLIARFSAPSIAPTQPPISVRGSDEVAGATSDTP